MLGRIRARYRFYRALLAHPVNRRRPLAAARRWLAWQLAVRLSPGPIAVPFVADARLLIGRETPGAWLHVYTGLGEFEEMSFALHLLRPDALMVDIGANIGAYTVLAAGAARARVIAVEPVPASFARLMANVRLNALSDRVEAHAVGLGARPGSLRFTCGRDSTNRVVAAGEAAEEASLDVPVTTMDALVGSRAPVLVKIDVEGFEGEVLAGAGETLARRGLVALIVEHGQGARYGADERALMARLKALGFEAFSGYRPQARTLVPFTGDSPPAGNLIHVRRGAGVEARLREAAPFVLRGLRF